MSDPLIASYRPGTTLLHRIPAGPKLALLAAYGGVAVVLSGPWTAIGLALFSVVLAFWGRLPLRPLLRTLRGLLVVALLIGGYQTWQRGWPTAVHVVGDLVALVLAAVVFTATTSIESVLDAITRGLRPLRRIGVDPDRIALAFSLMIRAIPGILEIARETRSAAKARGLERHPRALLVPLAIRTVARAYDTGAALQARGIGDD